MDPDLDPESKSGRISNFLRWSDPEPTYFKTFTFYAILMNTGRWSTGHYLHKYYLLKALKPGRKRTMYTSNLKFFYRPCWGQQPGPDLEWLEKQDHWFCWTCSIQNGKQITWSTTEISFVFFIHENLAEIIGNNFLNLAALFANRKLCDAKFNQFSKSFGMGCGGGRGGRALDSRLNKRYASI